MAEALLRYYLGTSKPKCKVEFGRTVIEDGFYVCPDTGIVKGRYLELDAHSGNSAPLYYYNRSWRFTALFSAYSIPLEHQYQTLRHFELLEKVWEREKSKYTRVYFLSQRLLLQEITKRLTIPSTQPPKRPISDIRRYRAQMKIFEELWCGVVAPPAVVSG
jgi:hypothetical protein